MNTPQPGSPHWGQNQQAKTATTTDYRLTHLMLREPMRCASLNEYSSATGIDTADLIELLEPMLEDGTIELEVHGDDVFVHTAPAGRSSMAGRAGVPANLWETLRERYSVAHAHQLWKLTRAMEHAGWRVEHRVPRIMFGIGRLHEPPAMGVDVGNTVVPLLLFPTGAALAGPAGLLSIYETAGAAAVGVVCAQGALDEIATAARTWLLSSQIPPAMSVIVMESPRFNPTLLTPSDGAVTPKAIAISTLTEGYWED